ncbi:MAG: hypothetical protein ACPHGY_08195 [Rhodospirillaceae bacterium]|jgi:hypothetical protein
MLKHAFCQEHLIAAAVLGAGFAIPGLSGAQQDPLAAICQGFLSSSVAPAPGNANNLCDCLVREVQANLNTNEMQAYQSATQAGRALSRSVDSKITAIAVKCLGQAQ